MGDMFWHSGPGQRLADAIIRIANRKQEQKTVYVSHALELDEVINKESENGWLVTQVVKVQDDPQHFLVILHK